MRKLIGVLVFFFSVPLWASQTFTVGVVPQFSVSKLHSIWKPILQQLEQETGYRFELQGSPDIPSFERAFQAGTFDLAYMNPYHYLLAESLYEPILRDTARQLYGIVVVKKDSPAQSLADLDGQVVALPAPNAMGASLMTRAAMTNDYNIDYEARYVKTHSSVYLNVLLGKAAAGGGVQKTFMQQPDAVRNGLRVLYQTAKVSPHPIVIRRTLPPEVKTALQNAFLRIAATENGRHLLSDVPFKKLGTAQEADYEPLRALRLEPFFQAAE